VFVLLTDTGPCVVCGLEVIERHCLDRVRVEGVAADTDDGADAPSGSR
jgi:hypothetical protein